MIRTMSGANPLWGAPRIHGELLKLGINVSSVRGREMDVPSRGTASVSTSSRKAECLYTRAWGDTSGADPMSRRVTRGCPPRIGYDSSQRER